MTQANQSVGCARAGGISQRQFFKSAVMEGLLTVCGLDRIFDHLYTSQFRGQQMMFLESPTVAVLPRKTWWRGNWQISATINQMITRDLRIEL